MKKIIIALSVLAISMGATAQKAKIYTAKEYMRDGDVKKALIAINEATTSESTKADGDAWFTRGEIYEQLAETDATALSESTKSYMKVLEVKPNYNKDLIDNKLIRIVQKSYNAGVTAYAGDPGKNQASDYDAAIKSFQQVIDIRQINGGAHFASNKWLDTVAGQALKFQSLSAFYSKKDEELALSTLLKASKNPIAREAFIFSTIIDIYTAKNDNASVEKTIDEAKSLYPKNADIARLEINYYLRTNKTDALVKKMEEAVKADPDNSILQNNLGILYGNLANPVDQSGNSTAKPANSKELEAKAEMAYKLAIDADPTKAEYSFNLGALYYNNATDIGKKMNDLGTSEAENKKYDALKVLRTAELTKSLPHFQKSYDLLNPKAASLSPDDMNTFRSTLMAMQGIYEVLGQKEKSETIAKRIAELGQ